MADADAYSVEGSNELAAAIWRQRHRAVLEMLRGAYLAAWYPDRAAGPPVTHEHVETLEWAALWTAHMMSQSWDPVAFRAAFRVTLTAEDTL